MKMQPLVTLSSDFEKQSQGVGNMEAVIYSINPSARVIHLMHGIESFDVTSACRTMEAVAFMPIGIHVCVVDPGVGTKRKALVVKTRRGDFLVGPDNGCLMTALRFLGGVEKIVEITNERFFLKPVSPIFHGRHVFAPIAAHLSMGVSLEAFGKEIPLSICVPAPYAEARVAGEKIRAQVIHVNKFGSVHLNVMAGEWDKLGLRHNEKVRLVFGKKKITLPFVNTFGDVKKGKALIMKDDYGRVEVAVNQGSFVKKFGLKTNNKVAIMKT